ncbi:MAG: hypothetical protein R3E08_03025 [Thiotrichaceae bacterium]
MKKGAVKLWERCAFAFQDWWITEFEAFSTTFGKKARTKAWMALQNMRCWG